MNLEDVLVEFAKYLEERDNLSPREAAQQFISEAKSGR